MDTVVPSVVAMHVGEPETLGFDGAAAWFDEPWTTAIFKRRVGGPTTVHKDGLAGDRQADRVNHGGPDKAICVYPAVHYPLWRADLQRELNGADFEYGAFGENFTVQGLTEDGVCIGDVYAVGREVIVQVSQPRQPCWKLARKWRIKDLAARAIHTGRTGWYFRVLEDGTVGVGDSVTLRERPHPEWTIAAANRVMHFREGDTWALAHLDHLSQSWKHTLRARLTRT
ncbi:MAG: MOSC domain-containing protein [Acidimicrobiia bacterium]|nr:MOSC domain-containing protein [Acidimicrobiia bacterium]